jgi:protein O-mannosyl-transferase
MAKNKKPTGPVRPAPAKPNYTDPVGNRANTPRPAATPPRPASTPLVRTAPTPAAAPAVLLPIATRPVLWWPPVVLAVIGVLLYANTFGHKYALDDIAAVGQNLFVKKGIAGIPDLLRTEFWHFSNISLGYYRPLSLITFALEQEYFGDNHPEYSHIINAILYGLTGLVLGVLVQKWLPGRTIVAFMIGLLFLAHPLHTEIVANIKGRDELMSFLFLMSMSLLYWRYLETNKWGWLVGAGAMLYLALLSKESSLVGLAFIPAASYFFARRSVWQSLVSLWPFLLVTVLFFIQKVQMIGSLSGTPPTDLANYPYAIYNTKGLTTFKFFAYYIYLLIYPERLVYDYSYNVIPSGKGSDPLTLAGLVLFFALIWLTWIGFRRRTMWGFGLLVFWATIMPGLGFIFSRGGIFAERFAYAAVLGYVFVLVWGVDALLARFRKTPLLTETPALAAVSIPADAAVIPARPAFSLAGYAPLLLLLTVVAGLYSFKTVLRNPDWKDNFTLFNAGLTYAPTSCQVQRHVANEWIEKGVKDRAKVDSIAAAVNAIKPKPTAEQVKKAQVLIDTNIARANKHGRWALDHLKSSTEIYPSFGEAYFSMAYVFQKIIPNRDSALYYYKQTMRAAPSYAPAYNNAAVIYQSDGVQLAQQGRGAEAMQRYQLASYYYNRSMQANPAYADGPRNHANLKKQTGLDVVSLPDSILSKY